MLTVTVTLVVVRRRIKLAIVIACVGASAYALLPAFVGQRIRAALVERGYPDAELEVASVGLRQLVLRDVRLADGIEIGLLELDRGLSLLWSDADQVSIKRAKVSASALAQLAPNAARTRGSSVPFKRARIEDSVLQVGRTAVNVSGTVSTAGPALDVTVSVSDPTKRAWSARGRGRIVLGSDVTLENGHVEISMPSYAAGGTTIRDAAVTVDVSGNLSTLQLHGTGTARAARADAGPVAMSAITVPFAFDRREVRVTGARATMSGGELALDPFVVRGSSLDLVLRARGLQLAELLAFARPVTGTGLVDGFVAVHVDRDGWSLERGELHARQGGRVQVADARWLARVSAAKSPFVVHERIANALSDFQYEKLTAELAPPGEKNEITLATRGRGRRNQQQLEIAINVSGVRDVANRLQGDRP